MTTIYNAVDLEEFSPAGDVADLDALAGCAPAGRGNGADRPGRHLRTLERVTTCSCARSRPPSPRPRGQAHVPCRAYIIGGALYDTGGSQYSLDELRGMVARRGSPGGWGSPVSSIGTAPALRALDMVVHASTLPEPFGLVIAEAMACGRATVVSAAGGAAEIVEAGRDALTHPPGDADALAAALARLAGDASLRQRVGAAARASAVRARAPRLRGARARQPGQRREPGPLQRLGRQRPDRASTLPSTTWRGAPTSTLARIAGFGVSMGGEVLLEAAARDRRLAAVVSDGAARPVDQRKVTSPTPSTVSGSGSPSSPPVPSRA